jgi:hypothetical protein
MLLRVTLAVAGGYALTAALVALLTQGLVLAGLPRSEATVSAAMLGFVIYLVVLLWAFSVRSTSRLSLGVLGGAALAWGVLQFI